MLIDRYYRNDNALTIENKGRKFEIRTVRDENELCFIHLLLVDKVINEYIKDKSYKHVSVNYKE